jgi:D-alanyl-D-alanine carboxypeptidase
MSFFATCLMIVFFPLNSLLIFHPGLEGAAQVQADNSEGLVKGVQAEKVVEQKPVRLNAQATDNPKYQPVRDLKVADLVIPNAHAFAVIDADTGKLLAGNHATDQRQIASLTKMMTATLAMEKIKDLDEPVTIGEEEVYVEGTKVGCPRSGYCISQRLKVGEQISAKSLLHAMLMNSANDTAIALGKHMAGSQEAFAKLMNSKVKELGLENTNFCTPSGLDLDDEVAAAGCFSSAYDIGKIAAYSMRYDYIWKIFRQPTDTKITSSDGKLIHTILNTDLVLNEIPNVIGGKTGFTPMAGYSLLMGATDASGKHRIVAVLLDDPNRWSDIRTAINWTFKAYDWQ